MRGNGELLPFQSLSPKRQPHVSSVIKQIKGGMAKPRLILKSTSRLIRSYSELQATRVTLGITMSLSVVPVAMSWNM